MSLAEIAGRVVYGALIVGWLASYIWVLHLMDRYEREHR